MTTTVVTLMILKVNDVAPRNPNPSSVITVLSSLLKTLIIVDRASPLPSMQVNCRAWAWLDSRQGRVPSTKRSVAILPACSSKVHLLDR